MDKTFDNARKRVLLALAIGACLCLAGVFGTLAYLQTSTDTISNVMTAGHVDSDDVTIDEASVDEYGVKLTGASARRTASGNAYTLLPGHTYVKDPTIHIAAGTEPCYLYVCVDNQLASAEATGTGSIASQLTSNGWTAMTAAEKGNCSQSGTVYYHSVANADQAAHDVVAFESFTLKTGLTNADLAAFDTANSGNKAHIDVKAYAVQADGFASALAAWSATFGA